MARPLEVWITLSKGSANLGETNEVKVSAAFQVPEGEMDLGAVVEEKFHELRSALHRALESEPPKEVSAETEVQVALAPEPPPVDPAAEGSALEPPFHGAEEPADAAPESGAGDSEEPLVTPAQERTVRSLCNAAGIGEAGLRAVLGDGYGKDVAALSKREAAGLILQLTQMRREHILRDKPEMAGPRQNYQTEQEVFSRNGTASSSDTL